jgi:uncharacterized membrane protein
VSRTNGDLPGSLVARIGVVSCCVVGLRRFGSAHLPRKRRRRGPRSRAHGCETVGVASRRVLALVASDSWTMTSDDADRTADDDASGPGETAGSGESGGAPNEMDGLIRRLERLVDPRTAAHAVEGRAEAAWRRATREEPRVQVTIAILVAIGLISALPSRLANHPRWVLPGLAVLLLIGVFAAKSGGLEQRSRVVRIASLSLIAVLSLSNAASAGRLIVDLVRSQGIYSRPAQLLLTGASIWLTNVIVFGLWYWEFDRGGPVERAAGARPYPDFLFPQMTIPDLAPAEWEPGFVDYLYVSFTNAMAFSPTDVMPMTRWAKLIMLTQSAVSVMTVALVIARAVNILK